MTKGSFAVAVERPPIGWKISRAWHRGSARRHVWAFCLVATTALLVSLALVRDRLHAWNAASTASLHDALAETQVRHGDAPVPTGDFATSLPAAPNESQVLLEVQRAASDTSVALVSMQAQHHPATRDRLGRLEVLLSLRGPYVGTKQIIKQVLERFPSATLQRLRMRKGSAPADMETQLTMSFWSAPSAKR